MAKIEMQDGTVADVSVEELYQVIQRSSDKEEAGDDEGAVAGQQPEEEKESEADDGRLKPGDRATIRRGANEGKLEHGDLVEVIPNDEENHMPIHYELSVIRVSDGVEEVFDRWELQKEQCERRNLKPGDLAVVKEDNHEHEDGDLVSIISEMEEGHIFDYRVYNHGEYDHGEEKGKGLIREDYIREATREEINSMFPVGTKVSIVVPEDKGTRYGRAEMSNSEVGTITGVTTSEKADSEVLLVKFYSFGSDLRWSAAPGELKVVERPEQIEKGDIIKVTKEHSGRSIGDVGVVMETTEHGIRYFNTGSSGRYIYATENDVTVICKYQDRIDVSS